MDEKEVTRPLGRVGLSWRGKARACKKHRDTELFPQEQEAGEAGGQGLEHSVQHPKEAVPHSRKLWQP